MSLDSALWSLIEGRLETFGWRLDESTLTFQDIARALLELRREVEELRDKLEGRE